MASGLPVQGKNPSGNSQFINVNEQGDVKVQLSGTSVEVLRQNRVIVTGKNLFDKSTVSPNAYIGSSGTLYGSDGWYASAPIAVFRGNPIYFNQLNLSTVAGTAFYDGTTFVSFVSNTDIIASGYKILVPDGVDNMRCSNRLIDEWQIEYYGTTEYEPYLENNFDVMLQKNIGDIEATIQKNSVAKATPGRNLFDYTQVVTGHIIGSTGSSGVGGSSWYSTPYIDIYPGNMLRFNRLGPSKIAGTAFYGDDGFISWYSNEEIINAGYTVQIPPNATKFRASNNLSSKNPQDWMIQYGKHPDEFEPYALNTPAHHLSSRINEIGYKIADNRILNYNTLNYWVVTATNRVYAVDQDNALYRYIPTYDNWVATGYTFPSRPSIGWCFDPNNVVLLVDSDIYRSTDGGKTFEVIAGDILTPLTNGIHGSGSVACFGEYTTAFGDNTVRIWRTANKGATWDVVLTLSDVRHFHTMKYFVDTKEWWATTGDTDNQCRFYKSVDGGLTWELAAGYSSVYRTVGLVKGAKDVLLWAADTEKDSAIFAGRKDNLPLTTRRTAITDGFSLGIAGSNDFLITHTRPEYEGNLRNNVYVSTDAGNTWCADYSVVAESPLNGAAGILGPDTEGNYYLRYQWLRPGYPSLATIQARPKAMRLSASPIDQGYSEQPVRVTLTSKSYRSGDEVSLPLESFLPYGHIDEPSLVITNTLDTSVTLSVMDNDPIPVAANKSLIERLPHPLLDTFSIDIDFAGVPTTGTLKVELIGVQKVPNDIRNMAKVVT